MQHAASSVQADPFAVAYVTVTRQVSIESFGRGLMRGMGWKPGEALGKTFKGTPLITHLQLQHRTLRGVCRRHWHT